MKIFPPGVEPQTSSKLGQHAIHYTKLSSDTTGVEGCAQHSSHLSVGCELSQFGEKLNQIQTY